MAELYQKYRPAKLEDFVGQSVAVKQLRRMIKTSSVPHALMFAGPSGVGKTSAAMYLRDALECGDGDFTPLNCADARGIEEARDIRRTIRLHPMGGKVRIWLLDEAHKTTGDFQNAILSLLEFPPAHAYFIICTTEPNKIIKTVRTRCTIIEFKPLNDKDMTALLAKILAAEKKALDDEVKEKIVEVSEGSPRKALVILEQVLAMDNEADQLACCVADSVEKGVGDIVKILLGTKPQWTHIAKILKTMNDEPETIRRRTLAYLNAVLLSGRNAKRVAYCIDCLLDHLFDSGAAGLSLGFYKACVG